MEDRLESLDSTVLSGPFSFTMDGDAALSLSECLLYITAVDCCSVQRCLLPISELEQVAGLGFTFYDG